MLIDQEDFVKIKLKNIIDYIISIDFGTIKKWKKMN